MNNTVITISREHGSGGRLIGKKLALDLGFLFYDRAIIELAAEKSGLSPEFIEQSETRASNSFLFNLSASLYASPNVSYQYDVPVNAKAYYAQAAVIEDLAEKGNCVIVGRCADFILRDRPGVIKVFIHANVDERIRRLTEEYKENPEKIRERVAKMDKGRANYHRHFTNEAWGDVHGYDLSIDSSVSGIDCAVDMIKTLVLKRTGK